MELNPYAKFLGDQDPIAVLQGTSASLTKLADRLPENQLALRRPEGKWSAREIVVHLADCELVFGFRVRQALSEHEPVIQPFDQARWAERYENFDIGTALQMFSAARQWNLLLFQQLTPEEWARQTNHPERGTMTVRTIAETMAGHDINHLGQLERMALPVTDQAPR